MTRTPDKTTVETVKVGGAFVARVRPRSPGWRWTEAIKPIGGTDDCQVMDDVLLSGHDDAELIQLAPDGQGFFQ